MSDSQGRKIVVCDNGTGVRICVLSNGEFGQCAYEYSCENFVVHVWDLSPVQCPRFAHTTT